MTNLAIPAASIDRARAAYPVVCAPPIAGGNADAALLELGARLDTALADLAKAIGGDKARAQCDEGGPIVDLENHCQDLLDEVERAPEPHTLDGLAVKARGALAKIAFGWDQEDALASVAEGVMRLAGVRPLPDLKW